MLLALVLSAGGLRGLAHIGVIKVLEKNNISIDIITGTSAGALIGGVYASGVSSQEIEEIALGMNYRNFGRLFFDFSRPGLGLIKGDKITKFIHEKLKEKKIENFPIKFACIAVDIIKGQKVVFKEGDAAIAIRASISVPGVFQPVKYLNSFLVDGGICEPLPIETAIDMGADILVASDVIGFNKFKKDFLSGNKPLLIDTLRASTSILEMGLAEYSMRNKKNVIRVRPEAIESSTLKLDSKKVRQKTIKAGEEAAESKIKEIKALLESKR